MTLNIASFGTCSLDGCDEICPWDMAAIGLDHDAYCKPDHALEALDDMDRTPQVVTLHDPQYAAPRPDGVDESQIDILREVTDLPDAKRAVEEFGEKIPGDFRHT